MTLLFTLLFMLSVVALVLELIRPGLVLRFGSLDQRTRPRGLFLCGLALLLCVVGVVSTAPTPDNLAGKVEAVTPGPAQTLETNLDMTKKEQPPSPPALTPDLSTFSTEAGSSFSDTMKEAGVPYISFTVDEYDKRSARTFVVIDQFPGIEVVRAIAKLGVQSMLDSLMKHNRSPQKEWFSASCWVHMPAGKGATGSNLVRVFGSAHYNYNTDQITWEDYK